MDPFTAISLGVSVVGGVAKMVDGFNQKKAAREKMRKLERAALPLNAFEALQVPTEQYDMEREEQIRQSQSNVSMLQQAGTRAIAGNIGKVLQENRQTMREIGADLGQDLYEKEVAIANEDANIERVREARLQGQIAQTGQQLADARQQIFSGIGDLGTAAGSFGAMREQQSAYDYGDRGAAQAQRKATRQANKLDRQANRNVRKSNRVMKRANKSGGANYSFYSGGN